MKILFINHFRFPDYQNDVVYHGLIESGFEVYETANPAYMLKSHPNPTSLYGKGFSIFAKLEHTPNIEAKDTVQEKVRDRFYDLVIFGSIHRDQSYLEEVLKVYKRNEVYFIDGEDSTACLEHLFSLGVYFKRERVNTHTKAISFAIPETQLLTTPTVKDKYFGTVVPGQQNTYIFNTEAEYYADYARSYYGETCKKAGWDCMRHYEILANRCIPYFTDLHECPIQTLETFPKDIILETNHYARQKLLHPNYEELNDELFRYTEKYLTTKKLITTILC